MSCKRKHHYSEGLRKTCEEFSKSSSLTGYKYLFCERVVFERFLWLLIQVTSTICVVLLVRHSWNEFMTNPTVTSLESLSYSVKNVPFPGISVCNINKISRRRAQHFAKELASKANVDEEFIFNHTQLFGNFYSYGSVSSYEKSLIYFQYLLETYDIDKDGGIIDFYKRLKQLATPCTEIIDSCYWAGNQLNCNDLFVMETTMEGFCCIFNYAPSQTSTQSVPKIVQQNHNRELLTPSSGIKNGLSITIYNEPEDYLYPLMPTVGVNVHVFGPNDYPDTTSGGLVEKLVPIGMEVFLRISSSTIYTVPEAEDYPISKRKCKFRTETCTILGSYSYSDCIMDCKLKSIMALCQCVPYNLVHVVGRNASVTCGLSDLVCLNKYKVKWGTIDPFDYVGSELDREKQDSLRCDHCVPACSDTLYKVKNEFSEIAVNKGDNITANHSVLHVFFEKPYGDLNRQDVLFTWYDIVSNFGGTCSIIVGISLISGFEFVYFFTIRFYRNVST